MKKFIRLILMIIICFSCVACSKDENEPEIPQQQEIQKEEARYYVKYEAVMSSRWGNTIKGIGYVSDKGSQAFTTTNSYWEGTYGPFSNGDNIHLVINWNNQKDYSNGGYNHARIYVSRDKEPFVIKAESQGNKDLTLKYTIDF